MPVALGEDEHLFKRLRSRSLVVFAAIILGSVVLVGRLWFLQVVRFDYYSGLSKQNRIRIIVDEAPRGLILDRDGAEIVGNRPCYDVLVDTGDERAYDSLNRLLQMAGLPPFDTDRATDWMGGTRTLRAMSDVDLELLAMLEEHRTELPGLEIAVRPKRRYRSPEFACHIVGYLGEVSKSELQSADGELKAGDRIGRVGVEAQYDNVLRGTNGRRLVETNATGRVLRTLMTAGEPKRGSDLFLTLDADLQSAVEDLFRPKRGAVVVMRPRTGEIVAMVSRPGYSLDAFEREITRVQWSELRSDADTPLNNRCVSGQYPPGSTFKIVVALAALKTGAVTAETTHVCNGSIRLGDATFHCWGNHGKQDIVGALAHSCNVFFYETGLSTGMSAMADVARSFGLGSRTGLDVLLEMPGHIPSREVCLGYWPGDVASCSIGQGTILVTPLQMAVVVSALVNGGDVLRPYVVRKVVSPQGEVLEETAPLTKGIVSMPPAASVELVRRGLYDVVNAEGGTGHRAKLDSPKVAGKTGTAQVTARVSDEETDEDDIPYELRPHSWFVCYAPADNPELVFVVLVEHGGGGGGAAASYAGEIVKCAFSTSDGRTDETGRSELADRQSE